MNYWQLLKNRLGCCFAGCYELQVGMFDLRTRPFGGANVKVWYPLAERLAAGSVDFKEADRC